MTTRPRSIPVVQAPQEVDLQRLLCPGCLAKGSGTWQMAPPQEQPAPEVGNYLDCTACGTRVLVENRRP